jgi:hypothetical protein
MHKIIKFATEEKAVVYPQPSRRYIPAWYRKAEKFIGGKPILNSYYDQGATTVKGCVPFLDAFTTGYTVELCQDVQILNVDGEPSINWQTEPVMVEQRSIKALQGMDIGKEYHEINFAWKQIFYIKLPKNYSLLVTHPLNHFDLPFTTISGVVDADAIMSKGNLPFLLKKDFEGIIPKGTPIAQLIPFKRDSWNSEIDNNIISDGDKFSINARRVVSGWYKNNVWNKKNYN